jgi:ABC-type phosphate transport system ATPase subunit
MQVLGESIYEVKACLLYGDRLVVYQTPVALPLSIRENVLFGPR